MSTPPQTPAFNRMQQLMSSSPVPSISTELLVTADGELNRELNSFLFDRPSDPNLLRGKRIAICCTNGGEEVEILGAHRWLTERGAMVHIVSPRIGEFHPTLGLRFPPQCATHVLAIRLMENAGWLKIDRYTDVWNIQIDLENAGAAVLDEPCVVDGNLITARFPYDLPRLVQAMVSQLLAKAEQASAAQSASQLISPEASEPARSPAKGE